MGDTPCKNAPALGELPQELSLYFSWLLSYSAHNLYSVIGCELKSIKLTFRSFSCLMALSQGDVTSQLDLSRRVGLDKTTMMATLDEMEKDGLVKREQSKTDRRVNTVALTRKGARRLDEARRLTEAKEREALGDLTDKEAETLHELLNKLVHSLQNNLTPGSCI